MIDSSNQPKILLVDDDPISMTIMRSHLQNMPYELLEASCVAEALYLARKYSPEMVVSDSCMPEHDGVDLLMEVRNTWKNLPFVMFFSGCPERPELTDILLRAMGATHVLSKPDGFLKIADVVRTVMKSY